MYNFEGTALDPNYNLKRLICNYKKHGRIIVAYDFDDTVHPTHQNDDKSCKLVRDLLIKCSKYTEDITMICYTCRGNDVVINNVIPYLDECGIRHDKVNEQSDTLDPDVRQSLSCKLLYSIFLDDLSGLRESFSVLSKFLIWLQVQKGEIDDYFGFDEFLD